MKIKTYDNIERSELLATICKDLTIEEEDINIKNIMFRNEQEAEVYFNDILKIYDNVLVRCIKVLAKFEDSGDYATAKSRIDSSIGEYLNFANLMLEKLKKQKSTQKGCGYCKSSINRDYYVKTVESKLEDISKEETTFENYETLMVKNLKTLSCPVCDDEKFVITETDENKLKSLKNKVEDSFSKFEEDSMAYSQKHGQKIENLLAYRVDIS